MTEIITISHGEWGYVTNMSDFTGGRVTDDSKTPDGRHVLSPGLDDHTIFPGIPDIRLRPHSGYGFVRPHDHDPADAQLWERCGGCRMPRLDYYVALRNGSPDPDAVGLLYPERLFVTGDDEVGNALPRTRLLEHLKAVEIPAHEGYWWPVQIFTGINMGYPVFDQGLKADTDVGPTWHSAAWKLGQKLPPGYDWEFSGAKYGTLYYETTETA